MQRRYSLKALAAAAAVAGIGFTALSAQAADTIKVGVLHALSGTMAISETALKDMALMTIDEINAKGGVLGKKLEPVVIDTASNWPLAAEKAKQLISQDKVAVTFGCWTSVCRKSVLPVYEENNALLFYPVQYEGEELSKNVFYTGAAPNQQAIPAVEYLMSEDGGSAKRWVLLGTAGLRWRLGAAARSPRYCHRTTAAGQLRLRGGRLERPSAGQVRRRATEDGQPRPTG